MATGRPLRAVLLATLALLVLAAPAPAATITVTTTGDTEANDGACSLREAIVAANNDVAAGGCPEGDGADTIVLPAGTYPIEQAGAGEDGNSIGDFDIGESATIDGAGADTTVIDGNGLDRVLHVGAGTVRIEGVTITGGRTPDGAGVVTIIGGNPVFGLSGGDAGTGG
ncbi:MAG TPA: CSLREA domain-containing protein, partial [Solirubrobacteraceae bacterium]